MIWNNIPGGECLHLWKTLRNDIGTLSLEDQLIEVAQFCANMPFGPRSIDYYTPASWPTPWEILYRGSMCTSAISVLMYYTLTMVNDAVDVKLQLVEDADGIYLLPIIDDQFVLNYELGQVSISSDVCNAYRILQTFTKSQIKTIA